jgi:hypothetical protein
MTPPTRPELLGSAFALIVLLAPDAHGAPTSPAVPKSLDEVCRITTCRPPTKVRVEVGENRYYTVDQPQAPYVFDGIVNVLADETVVALAKVDGDRIADLSYVQEPGKVSPVIVAHLESFVDEKGSRDMLLTVTNPFERPIRYTARIQRAGKAVFEDAATCPIPPHRAGAETWPVPLIQVLLKDFHFVAKDEAIDKDCEPPA